MNSKKTTEFTLPVRVYYEDTDAEGVVFYANYLKFFERARTEWLRRAGIHLSALATQWNVMFVVVSAHIQYQSPARLDDLLSIKTRSQKIGYASIDFEQICERDRQPLVRSHIQICCVDRNTFKATPIPDSVRSLLLSVQDI